MREMRERGRRGVRDDATISFGEKRTTDATEEIRVSTRDGGKEPDTIYVRSFLIDRTAVRYVNFEILSRRAIKTDAEKFKWSFVLKRPLLDVLEESDGPEGLGHAQETPWWIAVLGAYWRRPEGSDSSIKIETTNP